MINDFGVDAYFEARRREHEASSDAMAKDWGQIASAVARKMSKRIDVDPLDPSGDECGPRFRSRGDSAA